MRGRASWGKKNEIGKGKAVGRGTFIAGAACADQISQKRAHGLAGDHTSGGHEPSGPSHDSSGEPSHLTPSADRYWAGSVGQTQTRGMAGIAMEDRKSVV